MLKYLLLFCICPFLCVAHPNISKIPIEDQEKLERFFEYLIHNSMIGYSLCGEKPVSIETFPRLSKIPAKYTIKILNEHPGYFIVWNGIKTWNKYSYLFPSNNFVFRFIPEYSTIALINKKATKNIIEDNLCLFQKITKNPYNSEQFLNEVCFPKEREYLIKYDACLLGILLGYGKNNATAFSNKNYMQKLEGFTLYNSTNTLTEFMNPGFIIINNGTNEKENISIKKTLKKSKKTLKKSFHTKNYFQTFVNLLCR